MAGKPVAEVFADEALVRALLADQYPQYAHLPIRFSGEGWDNFMFRLGDDLAVRMPRRKTAVDLIAGEQLWLGRIAPSLPLPVPTPIAVGGSAKGFPWSWSIIPWIEGEAVDQAPLNADQGLVLAAFLRALHRPSPPDAPKNPNRGVQLETRRERLEACLERLRATSDLIATTIDRIWRDALSAPFCQTPVWLHGDLHAQNVLSKDGKLAGVIDWGDMCAGDAACDLCSVWGVLADASARAAALEAYAPDDALLARARGWAIVFGATLFESGLFNDPRHNAIGLATLVRLAEDL